MQKNQRSIRGAAFARICHQPVRLVLFVYYFCMLAACYICSTPSCTPPRPSPHSSQPIYVMYCVCLAVPLKKREKERLVYGDYAAVLDARPRAYTKKNKCTYYIEEYLRLYNMHGLLYSDGKNEQCGAPRARTSRGCQPPWLQLPHPPSTPLVIK